ncbi:MAG TPA: ubiquinone biosynthesis regulatory protein kinase UbiB [Xanthomonadales bacterium]|nr:ubiquinone biosynthesis regulatory protein kinase UbiB [Xanthomonadales bacterium]
MIHTFRQFARATKISAILARYRLDEVLEATHLFRPMWLLRLLAPGSRQKMADVPKGERLRLALQEMGPIFVKFGQILSTRRDLIPPDIADELALLQDRVAPFPGEEARQMVEQALGDKVENLFTSFDTKPLASASIAQVHAATLADGDEVVVKVVRPEIEKQLRQDIDLLLYIAGLLHRYWVGAERVRPRDIVLEFETFVFDELDMQREAANASMLRHNFEGSNELYIPRVYWPYCRERVLVLERVTGIPVNNIDALRDAGVNLPRLARLGIKLFYTQVFRDNLFHADMHPGNILVDVRDPANASFIAMDFGIVASLTPKDLYYIAENFKALFDRDYFRVAQLHVDAGWVPADTRVDEMEAAVRSVGEPNFTRPLNEISFGKLLLKLFQVARRFNLQIQPQLIMLQKTLLNIEGLGRQLHPDLDIWAVAKPELEAIMREKHGLDKTAARFADRFPGWVGQAPEMPGLIHEYLRQATTGQLTTKLESRDLDSLRRLNAEGERKRTRRVAGGSFVIAGAMIVASQSGNLSIAGYSAPGLIMMAIGAVLLWRSRS